MQKVNLSALASFELHLNFEALNFLFKYTTSFLIMLPIRKTWHLFEFNFSPKM